ncbi:hypothetical protein VB711_05895 [Cronbergia sp. UHCC 0137]|uniref:hypothetical protein n=1 Tax=Cronbergia sp. UHCC 0137 TaxID=3110239 RepID=UPI002B1FD3F5|nr:hypothetical protein [Cronbergia sp. UHCC 0137]MEA5617371.1 hypothetical protein [Cronbergia sp. UHCC 0137]
MCTIASVSTAMILWGCSGNGFESSNQTWKTYRNSRYGFEFPYPGNWDALANPDNSDGIVLVSPQDKTVEIRSWAGKELPKSGNLEEEMAKKTNHNFQTAQGVSGILVVKVDQQVSSVRLTITRNQVEYYWQGQSNSQKFETYYRLFYYIAREYRI